MDAKDANPADEWPLPPPWMWSCGDCAMLYKAMKLAPEAVDAARRAGGPGIDDDSMDSVEGTQIQLARHLAIQHGADVPGIDENCGRCVSDVTDRRLPEVLILEHRARHLFAPPRIVGLM